jgi:hypothetical protein
MSGKVRFGGAGLMLVLGLWIPGWVAAEDGQYTEQAEVLCAEVVQCLSEGGHHAPYVCYDECDNWSESCSLQLVDCYYKVVTRGNGVAGCHDDAWPQ